MNRQRRIDEALPRNPLPAVRVTTVLRDWHAPAEEGQRPLMKRFRLTALTAVMCTGIVSAGAVFGATAARADTTPVWEPDPSAVGTLNFFDASGNPLTRGSISDVPFAAYAVGDHLPRPADTKAILEFSQPNKNQSNPANWNVAGISSLATSFPVTAGAGVPTSISSLDSSHPVYTGSNTDNSLEQDIFAFPNTGPSGDSFDGASGCAYSGTVAGCTDANYENLYQIRLITTDGSDNSLTYDDADIMVDGATGTWSQVYPAPFVAANTTATTLSPSPASPTTQGTSVTLTATVTASDDSTPAGSVQFKEDGTAIGTPVSVTPTDADHETATYTSSAFNPGQHTFTATFSPTDGTSYGGSTSDDLSYLVNPKAKTPTITGTAKVGSTVTCNEPTTLGEAAAFTWKANGTKIGSGRTLTLPGSAAGKSLTCSVTLSVTGGTPSSATSAAKKVALGGPIKNTKAPAISGKAKVGKTVKVSTGSWSPKPATYSYQWLLNGKAIKHATKSSFKIVKKDKGKKLSCKVTAKKTGYGSGSATSKSVKVKK